MKFEVLIHEHPSSNSRTFTITGEDLLDAIKSDFENLIRKCSYYYIPFKYPIKVTPSYKKGILGGKGGVELELEWKYSSRIGQEPQKHTHYVWIYAKEEDLTDSTPFTIEGK